MDCRSDLVWQFLCSCVLPPPGARAKLSGIMMKSFFRSLGKTVELAIKNHLLINSENFSYFTRKIHSNYSEIFETLSLLLMTK